MARIAKISLIVAVLVLLGACRELPLPFEYDRVVAQVGDKKLRESDIQSIYAQAATAEDSTALLEIYVDRWVKKELKLRAAENLFRDSEEAIEAMVAEYRNSLLTRRLDQYYVDQELDTLFTDAQIEVRLPIGSYGGAWSSDVDALELPSGLKVARGNALNVGRKIAGLARYVPEEWH